MFYLNISVHLAPMISLRFWDLENTWHNKQPVKKARCTR